MSLTQSFNQELLSKAEYFTAFPVNPFPRFKILSLASVSDQESSVMFTYVGTKVHNLFLGSKKS